ncbi:hypothetical protein GCM10027299_18680 [Larkinella ripae]
MNLLITPLTLADHPEVVEVWEASVRPTHHFLTEEDIQFFKPLILNEYLNAVALVGLRDEAGKLSGFLGTADHKIEMLFIHPDAMGKGLGKILIDYAIRQLKATRVDVKKPTGRPSVFTATWVFRSSAGRNSIPAENRSRFSTWNGRPSPKSYFPLSAGALPAGLAPNLFPKKSPGFQVGRCGFWAVR